jgi:hypothetical protein
MEDLLGAVCCPILAWHRAAASGGTSRCSCSVEARHPAFEGGCDALAEVLGLAQAILL